ncbi:MAG: sugar-binding protein [Armatimonadetes bacterium]|nr:sugar-binding protein [Armatimonadota bacterium]
MSSRIVLAGLLATAIALAGCGNEAAAPKGPESSASATNGNKLKLAFITNNASDFWTIARKGVEKAEKEMPNVKVEFLIPGDGSATEQKRLIDDQLAKGIDGIAISPNDAANATETLNKVAKQAILVTQDSDAPKSDRAAYVGTDNKAAGVQAGEELKKALPNGGKVMVFVGKMDVQNAQDRVAGLREAVAGTKIEIIDVRTDDTDHARAKANVADTLVKYPDIAGLVGIWSYNGPAILNAVKEANMVGKVKIVCFDEEDDTLAGVKDGSIEATIVQQPFEFGYQSVKVMAALKEGKKDVVPANKLMIVPTQVIDKAGVDAFAAKLKELRGK